MKIIRLFIDKDSVKVLLLAFLLILGGYLSMRRGESKNIFEIRQYYMEYMRETD
jgi:hypothetical protein